MSSESDEEQLNHLAGKRMHYKKFDDLNEYTALHCDKCDIVFGMANQSYEGNFGELCLPCYIKLREEEEEEEEDEKAL